MQYPTNLSTVSILVANEASNDENVWSGYLTYEATFAWYAFIITYIAPRVMKGRYQLLLSSKQSVSLHNHTAWHWRYNRRGNRVGTSRVSTFRGGWGETDSWVPSCVTANELKQKESNISQKLHTSRTDGIAGYRPERSLIVRRDSRHCVYGRQVIISGCWAKWRVDKVSAAFLL
jgi:hypothetical protein